MPSGFGNRLDDEVANLSGQVVELCRAQCPQVRGLTDLVQRHDGPDVTSLRDGVGTQVQSVVSHALDVA